VKWRLLQFGGKLRGNGTAPLLHAANGIAKEPKRPIGQLLISRPLSVVPAEHLVGTDAVQRGHELIRKHQQGPAAATDHKSNIGCFACETMLLSCMHDASSDDSWLLYVQEFNLQAGQTRLLTKQARSSIHLEHYNHTARAV
jgi:hypothetical protein